LDQFPEEEDDGPLKPDPNLIAELRKIAKIEQRERDELAKFANQPASS